MSAVSDQIAGLEERLAAALNALRPFAAKCDKWEAHNDYRPRSPDSTQVQHRIGDFRAARAVMAICEPEK